VAGVCLVVGVVGALAACGGDSKQEAGPSPALRASALSLRQAMDASARAIDEVRATRDELERVAASLGPQIAQTNDVIGVLTSKAAGANADSKLLKAAREQRSFLQFAVDATRSRSSRAANSVLARCRAAGRRASNAYAEIAQTSEGLSGEVPASTTFNSGRLRDAVQRVNRRKPSASKPATAPAPPAAATETQPPRATTPPTSDDWPGGSAYTTILASVTSEAEARRVQAQASARGLDAGVLYSTNYRSLRPGYWVVFSGTSPDKRDADRRTARAKSVGYASAYPRFVSG
jgi:hypothetical protein